MEKHIEILVDRKEYITKEEAYQAINEQYHETGLDGYQDGIELMNRIAKIPAADVVEIRCGRWKQVGSINPIYKCDQCHVFTFGGNFCHNCGAKMDGGQK